MGPTEIVNSKSSLFLNSKTNISFMSTAIDCSEVTLASSQTKDNNCINSMLSNSPSSSSPLSLSPRTSLSNSIDTFSPDLLSTLSINTPSPKPINSLSSSGIFNFTGLSSPLSSTNQIVAFSSNSKAINIKSNSISNNNDIKNLLSNSNNSFNLNFNLSDFNVYYPPPLNISDDDELNNNNNNNNNSNNNSNYNNNNYNNSCINNLSNFISNKRKSPYLLRGEKKPSRCSECNRVILKYIVSVNGKKHHNNIFQKSNGYKCNQCQNAICEKCFQNYKINSNNSNNLNNNIDLKSQFLPISTSSINIISSCNSCINSNNNNI